MNTDTSFQDANPPSNLISSSKELKTLGFLAERFVRPPVSIILRFKSPVFVSHISFCTTVKLHHRSSLFEVFAAPYSKDSLNPQFVKIGRANLIQQHRSNDQRASKDEPKSMYPEICMLRNYIVESRGWPAFSCRCTYSECTLFLLIWRGLSIPLCL